MAVCAGILYGFNFTPIIYMQDNVPGSSKNGTYLAYHGIFSVRSDFPKQCIYIFLIQLNYSLFAIFIARYTRRSKIQDVALNIGNPCYQHYRHFYFQN